MSPPLAPSNRDELTHLFFLILSAGLSPAARQRSAALTVGHPCGHSSHRVVAKRCAAQIFASSHWVQRSPLPPTAQVILPSPLP